MPSEKLTIPLTCTADRNGKKYYIGRVQFPGDIDLREGAVFWVFVSEEGNEEIQIGVMDPEKERPRTKYSTGDSPSREIVSPSRPRY